MILPAGTITFLFTDIEGSSKLWEQHPESMRVALTRHDALLRHAIESNSGVVFKTIGDAFCAAFATATEALAAALASQCALHTESWADLQTLPVRMALHSGAAELRDNDYFGQPLNRVARLLAIGHGGQTLVSAATHELTRDTLPASSRLQDVGEHRLRDLGRPETVFQLLHPDLPSEFPPLKSLDNPALPNNLPIQVTSFIGREKEMAELKSLLGNTRLLTLAGSGGCGKTRLAMQMAANVLENYPHGVWFVELAPLADPALVLQTVAQALNVGEEVGKPLVQTLTASLKSKCLLLVLDNCEHVLAACAQLVDTLIRSCPHVRVLASSREGLSIAGETVYRIPSLSLPDRKQTATPASLNLYEATRLFIDRAMAVLPSFAVTNANAPALASVCHRIDGIPLAIELSAARVRSLSLEEINNKLDNCFRLLTGGSRTALHRHQTLRALIDWSYDLLDDKERALLCRLSVFAGGWTLEAAEVVGGGQEIEEWETLDVLTSLVDQSLVVPEQQKESTRYRLLETVRQYARDRLLESGEAAAVRERHQAFFAALAEEAYPQLSGPEQAEWLDRLEQEHDNLRAALEGDNKEVALRIAGALWNFWDIRGYLREGLEWLTGVLAAAPARTSVRAKALRGAGILSRSQGNSAAAKTLHQEGLALYQSLDDKQGIAYSLANLGYVARNQGDYAAARTLYEESLAILREAGDKHGIAYSLHGLGEIAQEQGDFAAARTLHEESLTFYQEVGDRRSIASSHYSLGYLAHAQGNLAVAQTRFEECRALCEELGDRRGLAVSFLGLGAVALSQGDFATARALHEERLAIERELGNRDGIAHSLNSLGVVALSQGDFVTARTLHEEGLALWRELGNKRCMAVSFLGLGAVALSQGDFVTAHALHEESLVIMRELGNKQGIAELLEGFAALALRQEPLQRALRLWGAAEAIREDVGAPLPANERPHYDRQIAQARTAMGEEAFSATWAEGRAMTMEQALAYAQEKEPV